MASLNFITGHIDDNITILYATPTVLWLKDGTPTRATPTNTPVCSNGGGLSTTLSFSFQESNAGVYQCVFMTNSELFVTIPIRLDIGE